MVDADKEGWSKRKVAQVTLRQNAEERSKTEDGEREHEEGAQDQSALRQIPLEVAERIIDNVNDIKTLRSLMLTCRAYRDKAQPALYRDLPLSRDTLSKLAFIMWPLPTFDVETERPLVDVTADEDAASVSARSDDTDIDIDTDTDDLASPSADSNEPAEDAANAGGTISVSGEDGTVIDARSEYCKRRASVQEITLVDLPSIDDLLLWNIPQRNVVRALGFEVPDASAHPSPMLPRTNRLFPNLKRVNFTAQFLYEWARAGLWHEWAIGASERMCWTETTALPVAWHVDTLLESLRGRDVELCMELNVPDLSESLRLWLSTRYHTPNSGASVPNVLDKWHAEPLPRVRRVIVDLAWGHWDYFGIVTHRYCNDWSLIGTTCLPAWNMYHPPGATTVVNFQFEHRFGAASHPADAWADPELWDQLHNHFVKIHEDRQSEEQRISESRSSGEDSHVDLCQKLFDKSELRLTGAFVFVCPPPAVQQFLNDSRFDQFRWLIRISESGI